MREWIAVALAMILVGGVSAAEGRDCSKAERWDEKAYCENEILIKLRSEINQAYIDINSAPELAEPISNDVLYWSSSLLNVCDDIACLGRHHYSKLSRLRHDLLIYQKASLVREAFSDMILDRASDDIRYGGGPVYDYVQIPLHSMPSARYWDMFRANPMRAYSKISGKPVHIYGQIMRIRQDAGNPVFELYGSEYSRVVAELSATGRSIHYGMDKSVGDSASLVCMARPAQSSRPELDQCIPHAEHASNLIPALIYMVEDTDTSYGFMASSKPADKAANSGIHGVSRIYSSALYGAAKIPLCEIAVTPECIAAIKESEKNGDMDGWVRSYFYFQET